MKMRSPEIEDTLVDYLEGDVTLSQKQNIELLLNNSKVHRRLYKNLRLSRQLVEFSDDDKLPDNPKYYRAMTNKIMKQLDSDVEFADSNGKMSVRTEKKSVLRIIKL